MIESYNIYFGIGSARAIDWDNPIGSYPAGEKASNVSVRLNSGMEYYFAARAVDESGMEESNAHVVVGMQLDNFGQPVELLSGPKNLQVRATGVTGVAVSFEHEPSIGRKSPDHFEIFFRLADAEFDLSSPAATVIAPDPSRLVYSATLAMPAGDGFFLVRSASDQQIGPGVESGEFILPRIPASPIAVEA